MIFHAYDIFFIYYIGTIVQEIIVARQVRTNGQNFLDNDNLQSFIMKFIESISRVYGHPKELIEHKEKETTPDVIVIAVTFNIKGNLQKDSLIAVMKDENALTARLDKEFKKDEDLAKLSIIDLSEPIYTEKSGKIFTHWLILIFRHYLFNKTYYDEIHTFHFQSISNYIDCNAQNYRRYSNYP